MWIYEKEEKKRKRIGKKQKLIKTPVGWAWKPIQ
jgi:hypothetical protein